ncbi:MAG: lantibiotic dehydratase, partial [Pseudonocardiaceae bacterium]
MGLRLILYRNTGVVLARASTDPGGLELPENVDLNDDAVAGPGRVWLARLWRRDEVRAALRVASPALSQQIDSVLGGGCVDARQMRRVLVSASSYLLRWQRRPTPFGLFAGVVAASAGNRPTTGFGHGHRVMARADAQW